MTKNSSRKSIIASFGALAAGIGSDEASTAPGRNEPSAPTPASVPRVGAGVIGATQRAISDIRDERDRLRALLDAGTSGTLEISPDQVDPSPFPDRLPDDSDADFETFRKSFETDGQKVPIQVRPHPVTEGRYQVIYGHRRLRAARELGLTVKALVLDMSDHDLVVAQGIENASRQDLTWIERAVFVSRMDSAGIKPRDIKASLVIDDAELAKLRSVSRAVPREIIEAIGRAPKVGRPRWLDFAQLMASGDTPPDRILEILSGEKNSGLGSDERFRLVFSKLKTAPDVKQDSETDLVDPEGNVIGRVRAVGKEFRIVSSGGRGAEFTSYLKAALPELLQKFSEQTRT